MISIHYWFLDYMIWTEMLLIQSLAIIQHVYFRHFQILLRLLQSFIYTDIVLNVFNTRGVNNVHPLIIKVILSSNFDDLIAVKAEETKFCPSFEKHGLVVYRGWVKLVIIIICTLMKIQIGEVQLSLVESCYQFDLPTYPVWAVEYLPRFEVSNPKSNIKTNIIQIDDVVCIESVLSLGERNNWILTIDHFSCFLNSKS